MAFDNYVKLRGSDRQPLPGAKPVGGPDPTETMQVTIVLRPQTEDSTAVPLADLAARGERLTREEYQARYGADPQDVKTVAAFATQKGLAVSQVNLASRTVMLTGTCDDFEQAFRVDLVPHEYQGQTFRQRTGEISIPTELAPVIESVHGLDNRPQAKTHFRIAGNPPLNQNPVTNNASKVIAPLATVSVSYTPVEVAKAYSFPSAVNGAGQTIGIIELGGGFTQSDLDTYFQSLNISSAPAVTAVSVDGALNAPTGDPNGPDTEVMLDIEVAGAVAPGANIVVYFAPNTDAGFLDAINQAIHDTVNRPSVLSISWGGPESGWMAQSLQSYNSALQAASVLGVTVCVACGDSGSSDGVTDGQDHVDFPASSPYALACGGTKLTLKSGTVSNEVVWNGMPASGATGGGVSQTFPLPAWQSQANVPPSANPGGFIGRGLPDVAGDADPATGYTVQVDGSTYTVGGTSAVAPLWAGLVARVNQSLGRPVGYLNPSLYQKVSGVAGTFRDIISGNNGDYKAGPGWDACTGWGSPDGAAILQALASGSGAGNPIPQSNKGKKPRKPTKPGKP